MIYDRPPMPLPSEERRAVVTSNFDRGVPQLPPRNGVPQLPPRNKAQDASSRISCNELEAQARLSQFSFSSAAEGTLLDFDNILPNSAPLAIFPQAAHEVPLPSGTSRDNIPVQTNKFYGNMLLGNQTNPIWTHPYSLWFAKDPSFFGLAVSHTTESQRVYGPGSPPPYFFSPNGIKSIVFSAQEFDSPNDLSLNLGYFKHLSAQAYLQKNSDQYIHFPLIQGMGFVTAVYHNVQPKLQSAVGFLSFNLVQSFGNIRKYNIMLQDQREWTLYVTVPDSVSLDLNLLDGNTIAASQGVPECTFQVVVGDGNEIDSAAGCYPTECSLTCSTTDSTGYYSISYSLAGSSSSAKTLLYALPHHVRSFTDAMASRRINSQVQSTVCGVMTGYITNIFELAVSIPTSLEFQPFTTIPGIDNRPTYSDEVLDAIRSAASSEVNGDVINDSNLNSMYFSGKILAKYAWILYCCQYIINDSGMVSALLPKLKTGIGRFVNNEQILPLKYETTWGGLISTGAPGEDFGNAYYNDHHFHYSYHVIAAAIVAKVDRDAGENNWLAQNKEWVENLLRDYANPSQNDIYFPAFRAFDWFCGHSWAKGLFESGDGKDEESSSEDVNASYALKLWALATENRSLASLADLQLGVLNTSINSYFLYSNTNDIMPAAIIPNKVSGILFENKIDHTTYFGAELQYIQMIHAIPITPASSFIRHSTFVQEEWNEKLAGIVEKVNDGWKGIMLLNVALFEPRKSYDFFHSPTFTPAYLDPGQSLTWSLAYAGAFL